MDRSYFRINSCATTDVITSQQGPIKNSPDNSGEFAIDVHALNFIC